MSDYKDPFCILPLRDIVVFPNMIVPLFVGRIKSIKALEYAEKNDKEIFLVAQKDANIDEPGRGDIYDFGTVANILQLLKLPDGTVKVLVEGLDRAKVSHYVDNPDFFEAYLDKLEAPSYQNDKETNALSRTATNQFENYVKLNRKVPPEILVSLNQISDLNKLADTMSAHLGIRLSEKQDLLECLSVKNRLSKVIEFMDNEIGVLQVEKKIRSRVKRQMDKTQKEYYLNEQIKAIQKELGETSDPKDEIAEIEQKAEGTKVIKSVKPGQQFVKIIHDELVSLLGEKSKELSIDLNPLVAQLGTIGEKISSSMVTSAEGEAKKNKQQFSLELSNKISSEFDSVKKGILDLKNDIRSGNSGDEVDGQALQSNEVAEKLKDLNDVLVKLKAEIGKFPDDKLGKFKDEFEKHLNAKLEPITKNINAIKNLHQEEYPKELELKGKQVEEIERLVLEISTLVSQKPSSVPAILRALINKYDLDSKGGADKGASTARAKNDSKLKEILERFKK